MTCTFPQPMVRYSQSCTKTPSSPSKHLLEVSRILTYSLSPNRPEPLYEQLYLLLRADILSGRLHAGDRLPSRRSLSKNLGVSAITVENAYAQLMDEGFVFSEAKRGYYISDFPLQSAPGRAQPAVCICRPEPDGEEHIRLSSNRAPVGSFPFSVWARLLRETVIDVGEELLLPSPCGGIEPLRAAIASHLASFRGMTVDPAQIIVGAGTEYLYGLLIQLLGRGRVYCLEDPGYQKPAQIYLANGASCRWAAMDASGITVSGVEAAGADVIHISPTHHFPTGITMPAGRRYELLNWAAGQPGRYIIEDDYDSEFRLTGRPIPSLQSIDEQGRVIYMNTFSKTLAPTIRISYMVLPPDLANEYYDRLSFYSCTVSTFEQHTLSRFLNGGYFEKHINRMRLSYARLRKQILRELSESRLSSRITVLENDSGLHFLLCLHIDLDDDALVSALSARGISLMPLSKYYRNPADAPSHTFVLNYSSLSVQELRFALDALAELI